MNDKNADLGGSYNHAEPLPALGPRQDEDDIDVRDCWGTPADLFCALDREFGFSWDLAADATNAKCYQYIDAKTNSLLIDWHKLGGWLFLNPPFSDLAMWLFKVCHEWKCGAQIVVVFPSNRFDREWMHRYVIGRARELRVSKSRPNYIPPPGVSATHPQFGTAVAIFDSFGPRFPGTKLASLEY